MLNKILNFTITTFILFYSATNVYAATIVGTWKLISFEMKRTNKRLSCHSPTGLLTYTAAGYVAVGFNCMQLENSQKPSFKLNDMTFYTGKYVVEGNTVTHIIQNASSPDYYNKKLIRKIDLLTDDKLVLSLQQAGDAIIVKWDRVG